MTIELEGRFIRGRGSVDEYLEQTAIANPHVTLHYNDPEGNETSYHRSTTQLPPEPKEIKPHPYGIELGRLVTMLKDTHGGDDVGVSDRVVLARQLGRGPQDLRSGQDQHAGRIRSKIGRQEADALYQAIQNTRISAPATDCLVPIGEQLHPQGPAPGRARRVLLRRDASAGRLSRQSVLDRSRPGLRRRLAAAQKVSLEALTELLGESDARTLRQFLMNTFDGIGSEAADKILTEAKMGTRQSPAKLKKDEIAQLHAAMQNVNLSRRPVDAGACATPTACRCSSSRRPAPSRSRSSATTGGRYGLSQSRGNLPQGPVTVMVHMASVWVPFTSESKEAIAGYPEIQKELRLGLQAVGRKLGMYLNRRQKVKQEGERRIIFLRYLGEVADAPCIHDRRQARPRRALREAAARRQAQDRRGRHEARRPRQEGRGGRGGIWRERADCGAAEPNEQSKND